MARVSVIVPAFEEERYIGACVASIRAQDADLEVIVADGRSSDRTAQLARGAGARVIENPARTIPAGLNRALQVATGDVIVRFDAHAEMPPGYIAACLRALDEEPGAVNVGGWRAAEGLGPWGRALGAALGSPAGVGNARIWRRPPEGEPRRDTDTVPLGCFRADELRAAGGWNEALLANEDFELNHRLRRRGGRVVFDPAIWSVYRPRESLREVALQYWRYGTWKAQMLAGDPGSVRPRQLAPLGLLAVAALAPVSRSARRVLALYLLLLGGAAARTGAGWRVVPTLATMHLVWGAGVVAGLLRRP